MSSMAKESFCSDNDDDVYSSRQLPVMDPDMLQDVLCILAKQNDEAVREPEEYLDHLSPSSTVELLFQTCTKLELPICVQISAVEYLDRFLVQHVRDLRKQLGLPSSSAAVSWDSVVGRMRDQVMLRMLSCIQLASKMFSSVRGLNSVDVRDLLKSAGDSYGCHSVVQSELRVLRTLKYRLLPPTPLVYAEVLLEVIGHNEPSFEPKDLYSMMLRVLQGFYLVRQEVHERALAHLDIDREATEKEQNRMIRAFKADKLLIASSVIASAVKIKFPQRYTEILGYLQDVTRLSGKEVHDFSTVVMAVLFNEDPLAD
ncbi:cyclin N-terminal domain-containing protein 1 isoform X1 [Dermacentor silvarum]|uniref:cyclin N-terminal domain-containing protein 1 isoform X1 n=1 Tax=Dermacentor silvarum TaxID=543639 RepID=UPI0018979CBD|nr:cyclin N-terminal domain-containing protein 1 isoform X1 [Dermacentor silvarum]